MVQSLPGPATEGICKHSSSLPEGSCGADRVGLPERRHDSEQVAGREPRGAQKLSHGTAWTTSSIRSFHVKA